MPIPVAQSGADQTFAYSPTPVTVTLAGAATNTPITSWKWTMLTVPAGSSADSGANQDFTDGVALVQNPQFDADIPGCYVLQLEAENASGWSLPILDKASAQTLCFMVTEDFGWEIPGYQAYRYDPYLINTLLSAESILASHVTRHESGGLDEMSVAGLAGLLADPQTPLSHATSHEPGGADTMAVDAAVATGSLRTLGTGAQQACAGDDARLSDSRTPLAHFSTHQPGGSDVVSKEAAEPNAIPHSGIGGTLSGDWMTYGSSASTVCEGDDSRLSDARTPTAHAASHQNGGSDEVATATPAANAIPKAGAGGDLDGGWMPYGTGASTVCEGNDSRLSDARTPTAHATSHEPGGGDAMAVDAVAGTGSLRTLGTGAQQACAGNDSRLSDARTPTSHASSHQNGGSDEVATATPAANAIPKAGAGGDLDGGWMPYGTSANTVCEGNDSRLSDARTPTSHASSHQDGGSDEVATATPGAAAIPKADGSGKLDSWVSDAAAGTKGIIQLAEDLGGTAAAPTIEGLGGDPLPADAANGFLKRNSANDAWEEAAYGSSANTVCEGNDSRLSDARTPISHATSHEPGGGDAMSVDAAAATGSLRTLGTGAQQACAGNDSRLSDARTPTSHASSHQNGGSDEVATATPAANAIPKAGAGGDLDGGWMPYGTSASTVCEGNDSRLSDARTPTSHASSHQNGGSDEVATATPAANAIPKAGAGGDLDGGWLPYGTSASTVCEGNDSRLSDARTPTSHATSHEPGGGDAMAVDAAAATGSLRTLGTGAQQACAGNDSRLSDARTPTSHASSHQNGGADEVATATPAANAIPKAGAGGDLDGGWMPYGTSASTVCEGNDSRLSDARTPTSHATSHENGGGDEISVAGLSGELADPQPAKNLGTPVTAQASTPLTLTSSDSGKVYTNEGASAQIVFNLPTAAADLNYTFIIQDTDGIQVVAASGDTIRVAGSVSAAAGNIAATTVGNTVQIVAINATEWVATYYVGTWTVT